MLEVKDRRTCKRVSFSELQKGEIFSYESRIFMKISRLCASTNGDVNAVEFSGCNTGSTFVFQPDYAVELFNLAVLTLQ